MSKAKEKKESIFLGGGCFWCLEAVFLHVKGIENVTSGYAGVEGSNIEKKPTYEQICSGNTGYAEVVKLDFDPEIIKIEDILRIFFSVHNPTTLNRQGNDIGSQYRSIILYSNEKQKKTSEEIVNEISSQGVFKDSIVTEIKALHEFYRAEEYHQRYFEKNPEQTYCQIVIEPKIAKLRERYKKFYK